MDKPRRHKERINTPPLIMADPSRKDSFQRIYWLLVPFFCISLGYYLWAVSAGWNNTITDSHAFRQTQTAITTYYMVKQPFKLAYETPVLGPPWSIPMEFPLYQWIVATLVKTFGFALDQTGRFVSACFYLLTLIPVYFLLGTLRVRPIHRLAVLSLLLVSPFYIFWSRTFMIETCGLFLSTAYLACTLRWLEKRNLKWLLVLSVFCGTLGALVKITTFLPFALLAGLFVIRDYLSFPLRMPNAKKLFISVITASIIVGIPFLTAIAWAKYADSLKEMNALGRFLTSKSLDAWNFGTFEQKTSAQVWWTIIERIPELFSTRMVFWVFACLAIPALLATYHRRWKQTFACCLLFFLAPAIMTNLHFVHNYYMVANGAFLIMAVGLLLIAILERPKSAIFGIVLFGIVISGGIIGNQTTFLPVQRKNANNFMPLAIQIRDKTPPDAVNIYVGFDWDPMIPYYSERRSLMIPEWAALNLGVQDVRNALLSVKNERIGSVFISRPSRWSKDIIMDLMKEVGLHPGQVYLFNP